MARSILVLVMFLLVLIEKGKACDACGCSVSGVGIGLMATYRQNYIGFQYHYAPFSSTLEHAQSAMDGFHTFELVGRFRVWKRFTIQLNQPYRLNIRQHPDGNDSRSGLSDTRLTGSYVLFDQVSLGKNFNLYAEAGAGVKAPTGKFDPHIHDQNLPENFNPGNGSWAWLLQSNLVLSYKTSGLALTGVYQHNRPSADGYHFGSQWSAQALLFHQFSVAKHLYLTPFGGASAEKVYRDETADGKYAPSTGGKGWFAAAGMNLKANNWLLGLAFSQPVSQHYSNAEVEAKGRITAQFSYIF